MKCSARLKIVEGGDDIHESLVTVNKPVNFNSSKNMVYDLPNENIRIEKVSNPYGDKVRAKLTGNYEIFTISLTIRYVEVFGKDFIDSFNRHAKKKRP